MRQDLSLSYTSSLVAIIEHEVGRSLELRVREAFLQVPRHAFLQRYYEGRVVRTAPPLSDKAEWHTWLASMYRDQALTTEIDERGLPTSSSSQPSVMAALLEELSTPPGHTILEIGTGTGYNAALLATLVGDPHLITTVDINPALVDAAHRSIEHIVGPGVSIHTWNGIDGYAPHAPYDRIIATGSYLPIPQAWIAQLKPEGKLVMDLRGHLSGGLLTLTKHTDGTATGAFLSKWQHIGFMQLRSPQNAFASPPSIQGYQQFPLVEKIHLADNEQTYEYALHFSLYEHFHGKDDEVNVWLQWCFPGLSIKWKRIGLNTVTVLTDHLTSTVATLEQKGQDIEVSVWGTRPLWSEIVNAYQGWLRTEKPGLEQYTLLVDQQGRQTISIKQREIHSRFTLPDHLERVL